MAKPAGADVVNILQSASKRASKTWTGFVEEMECRPKFMEGGRASSQIWNTLFHSRAGSSLAM